MKLHIDAKYTKMVALLVTGGSPSARILANPSCGRRPDHWAREAIEMNNTYYYSADLLATIPT